MDFKHYIKLIPLMNPTNIEPVHKQTFCLEGSAHFARLMNTLTSISACVYCYQKELKGSGVHVISGTYRYGFSNLNVELTCNWNQNIPNVELHLWPKEGEDDKVVQVLSIDDVLDFEILDRKILELVDKHLPKINHQMASKNIL